MYVWGEHGKSGGVCSFLQKGHLAGWASCNQPKVLVSKNKGDRGFRKHQRLGRHEPEPLL